MRKIVVALSLLVVVVALSILVATRWNVWFGNIPEPPYKVSDKIEHLLMTYGSNGEESRCFTWMCGDTVQPAILQLAVLGDTLHFDGEGTLFKSRSGKAAYYKAEISSLPEGLSYSYRVLNSTDTTGWYTFRIPYRDMQRSFIYLGDVQDDYTGVTPKIFSEIFEMYPDVDFYLFGGDVIERPMSGYWDYWFASMQDIPKTKPILAAAGNHEYLKGLPPYIEERFGLVFPYASSKNNRGNALLSIKLGDAQIMLLDSNKDFWKYFYQRRWLKSELKNSDAKWQIVTMHHPIYSTKGRFNQLLQRIFFNPVIKNREVDLVLQGHEHTFMRTSPVSEDGSLKTPIYLTSHCSPKSYKVKYPADYAKMDNGDKYYQLIQYDYEKMEVETYNSQHQLIDKVEILPNQVIEIK
ncbi:MAG: metallophosphoesterase family protein [Bacteroidales bacterium]|nr:metallophosphoesterase family protein [Bacteroidales bacterium]